MNTFTILKVIIFFLVTIPLIFWMVYSTYTSAKNDAKSRDATDLLEGIMRDRVANNWWDYEPISYEYLLSIVPRKWFPGARRDSDAEYIRELLKCLQEAELMVAGDHPEAKGKIFAYPKPLFPLDLPKDRMKEAIKTRINSLHRIVSERS